MRILFKAAVALVFAPGAVSILRGHQATDETEPSMHLKDAEEIDNIHSSRKLNQLSYNQYGCNRKLKAVVRDPSASNPNHCDSNTCGVVNFACSESWESNGLTEITYSISGLTPGKHALHVHQFRVGTDGENTCTSTGGHFNPEAMNHGGNLNAQRHIGDLGNILADESGLAEGTLLAYVPLKGELGVRGKAVVVHAGTDDLGTGGDDGSRAVGNAGARPGCGNIRNARDDESGSEIDATYSFQIKTP